jgi:hypothetical protein
MIKFIVDFEQDELIDSVLYALLHSIDRFTINDNSEPTMIDSVDPNGPAWILVDEGMRERHDLILNMFSVSLFFSKRILVGNIILETGGNFFFMRKRNIENSGSSWNDTGSVREYLKKEISMKYIFYY